MTYNELLKKSPADLRKLLAEQQEAIRTMRFKLAANQFKPVRQVRVAKRLIARIRTRLTELTNQTTT